MTKFIYDTKSIMTRAWEIARETHAALKHSVFRNRKYSVRNCLPDAMTRAWSEAKAVMIKASTANKKSGRYVELLAVAESNGLNHGRSWRLNSDTCSVYGINPMHEGELVCYVYSN
ncbi:TPA: hypothetical protein OT890_003620 [Raoultella ornithinolytica]|nr:hypothetical protein [Raoultella ornithinolytica]